ncbi:MAG: sodium:calcium symporter [Planctomycetota bacterium]|nr:MAG: sodium:calcium symporter [Planctomycetota bacterium]
MDQHSHGEAPVPPRRTYWNTRMGVVLAVAGSAVGLGNFVRFPAQVVDNGGGAFMIPYFIALLLIGLPIAWSEWAMGRAGGIRGYNSAPGIFSMFWPRPGRSLLGGWSLMIPVGIFSYYIYIQGWCLAYAYFYLVGHVPGAVPLEEGGEVAPASAFFLALVGYGGDGEVLTMQRTILPFVGICMLLNLALVWRGLNRGIEWFCRWAMPLLVVVALVVLVRVLTLGSVTAEDGSQRHLLDGLGYMWNPSSDERSWYEALSNPGIWMAATSQIFFSLSIGLGVIVVYASYLRRRDDVALSSTTAVAGNGFCEVVLGGLIVIPAIFLFLGMAGIESAAGSTLGTGFMALPSVFVEMPMGRMVGFLFFSLLFLAAVTSSISMLQPGIAFLEEGLGLRRTSAALTLAIPGLIGLGLVLWLSGSLIALDTIDFWMGSFAIFVLALVQLLLFGWSFGIRRGMAELHRGADIRLPMIVGILIKYVAPVYLGVIFIAWLVQQITAEGDDNRFQAIMGSWQVMVSFGFVVCLLVLFTSLAAVANMRWRQQARQGLIPDPDYAMDHDIIEEDAP